MEIRETATAVLLLGGLFFCSSNATNIGSFVEWHLPWLGGTAGKGNVLVDRIFG